MKYHIDQLKEALYNEYEWLCHDDYDPDDPNDMSPEEYGQYLDTLTYDQLIEETSTDPVGYPLDEYIKNHTGA